MNSWSNDKMVSELQTNDDILKNDYVKKDNKI